MSELVEAELLGGTELVLLLGVVVAFCEFMSDVLLVVVLLVVAGVWLATD
jgi:hypothetical protein